MLRVPMVDKKQKKAAPVPGVPEITKRVGPIQLAYRPGYCFVCQIRLIPSGGLHYRCQRCTWLKRHKKFLKKRLRRAERLSVSVASV